MRTAYTVTLFFLLRVSVVQTQPDCDKGPFTSPFLGRCGFLESDGEKCQNLWSKFRDGFCNKEDKNIDQPDYDDYAGAASHSLPEDYVTFYSGLSECGIQEDYVSISKTMLGLPVNGTHWISDPTNENGYGYVIQNENDPRSTTERAFWGRVSREYASLARGHVRILLDGLYEKVFYEKTIFAQDELPNLNSELVTGVTVYVVGKDDHPPEESCGEGTLADLENLITNTSHLKGYQCVDNLEDTREVFCRPQRSTGCRTNTNDCWIRVPRMMAIVSTAPQLVPMAAVWSIIISTVTEIVLI